VRGERSYAAVLPAELPEPEEAEDEDAEEDEEDEDVEEDDFDDAGELLDDEPRLSFR
jgi:hypothetical protein